ncbi:hydroxyacylglutathione hydrolase [Thalassotalea sp. SU-HH00458]|uniref:hydroxyacylglutathione hydrolase n=1 Tax=Thalassotalea sp. SU-HH00458 TaxID=3127657 RepID=UPI0031035609
MNNQLPKAKHIISPIKAFKDNYIWTITSKSSEHLVLVDPGDAKVCIEYIEKHNKTLTAILITHHHADHIGGIEELHQYCQNKQWPLAIYTPLQENIPFATQKLQQGDTVELPNIDLIFNVIDLPGHTLGHIAYYADDILFCGDTLFSGGCGRIFEGTPQQMHTSLNRLSELPERTRVYCTHEYTLANLTFALTVDPTNIELIHYYNQVKSIRAEDKITLPSSILREKQINPFLRCHDEKIRESVEEYFERTMHSTLETFTNLRGWKDNF